MELDPNLIKIPDSTEYFRVLPNHLFFQMELNLQCCSFVNATDTLIAVLHILHLCFLLYVYNLVTCIKKIDDQNLVPYSTATKAHKWNYSS